MVKKFQNLIRSISIKRVFALFSVILVLSLTIIPLFSITSSAYVNNDDVFYFYVLNDGGSPFVNPDVIYYINSYDSSSYSASSTDLLLTSPIDITYHMGFDYYYGGPVTVNLNDSYVNVSTYVYYNRLVIDGIDDIDSIKVFNANGTLVAYNDFPNTVPSFDVQPGYYYLIYTSSGDSTVTDTSVHCTFNLAVNSTGGGGSDDSYDEGYNDGYNAGYNDGYDVGTNDGYSNGLEFSLYNTIMQPIDALFTLRIGLLPIGDILLVVVGVSLVVIFLKYFAGG